jgi:hypothetical protein
MNRSRLRALAILVVIIAVGVIFLFLQLRKQFRNELIFSLLDDVATYSVDHEGVLPESWDVFVLWTNAKRGPAWKRESEIFRVVELNWGRRFSDLQAETKLVWSNSPEFRKMEPYWNDTLRRHIQARLLGASAVK